MTIHTFSRENIRADLVQQVLYNIFYWFGSYISEQRYYVRISLLVGASHRAVL